MEATPPFPVVSGQRQLAAIMFTDAVNFSARMEEQEVATLNRLERDFEYIRRAASNRAGTVLKSTGDGLLITFGSAVQAVGCALDIQQGFASRQVPGETGSSLQHRIGIHLGDVFVSGDDVMGDGVNIAARIVSEAPPGGIVVSQMVHDLVRNKIALHAQRLGPRPLKNIKEPITLFRILLDVPAASIPAPAVPAPASPQVSAPAASGEESRTRPVSRPLLVTAAIVALTAATWFVVEAQRRHARELAESQSAQASLEALLRLTPVGAERPQVPAADWAFAVTSVPAAARQPPEPATRLQEAERLSQRMLAWLPGALAAHPKHRPLQVPGLGDPGFSGTTVFTDAGGELFFAEGGAFRPRRWADLGEAAQAAVIVAAVQAAPPETPAEIRAGAKAFAYLRGRPEMVRHLGP